MINQLLVEPITRATREIASETSRYAILISADQSKMRLGWISPSTGLTYCGICLRSPIATEIGATCHACRAEVARTFELSADSKMTQRAWMEASLSSRKARLGLLEGNERKAEHGALSAIGETITLLDGH